MSVREAVESLATEIRAARARGCTDKQILDMLRLFSIDITESTLRAYLSDNNQKTKPPRKGAAVAAAAAGLAQAAPEPAPILIPMQPAPVEAPPLPHQRPIAGG